MNKQELTTIIRTIVREEVERTLPNVLVEILAAKVSEGQAVVTERTSPSQQLRRQAPQPMRKFSTNPILNQILNETHGGIPSDPEVGMVSSGMSVPGQQVSILDKMRTISKEQLAENREVAGVFNVLNRDFRQVVRAVDKKANVVAPPPNFKMTPGMFDDAQ